MTYNRTYGRDSGEHKFRPMPMVKNRRRAPSRLFEGGHAKYPQTGAYAVDPPEKQS